MREWSVDFQNHLQHKFAHVIKELTCNFEVEFKTSFCKMRNAVIGIDDLQISLCRGEGYEIFACTLYIQTASYPAKSKQHSLQNEKLRLKSMICKSFSAGVKVMKHLQPHQTFKESNHFPFQLQTDFHLLLISLVLCELLLSVYAIPVDAIASARSFCIIQISMYLRIGLHEFMFLFSSRNTTLHCSRGKKCIFHAFEFV